MKPQEQLTLEPYERDHAVVVGVYRFVILLFTLKNIPKTGLTGNGVRSLSHALAHTFSVQGVR